MTQKELSNLLNGRQYGEELTEKEENDDRLKTRKLNQKLNDLICFHYRCYEEVLASSKTSLREIRTQDHQNFLFDDFLYEFIRLR